MRTARPLRIAALALLAGAASAQATPWLDSEDLQRNGAVSRHLWQPEFANAEVGGLHFSAGVAIGLRGAVQASVGRNVAPALMLDLGQRSSLSLLPTGNNGAMLVWQKAP